MLLAKVLGARVLGEQLSQLIHMRAPGRWKRPAPALLAGQSYFDAETSQPLVKVSRLGDMTEGATQRRRAREAFAIAPCMKPPAANKLT
jgi:hypothetical protein